MTRFLLPFLALIAAAFATYALVENRAHRVATEPPSAPPVAKFSHTVAGVGLIEPNTENIAIGTAVPGVVQKVFVTEGQMVKVDEPLFQLDIRHLEATLLIRRASLITANARSRSAQTALDDATEQFNRAKRLSAGVAISTDEMMRRTFAVKEGEARLGESQAEIVTARGQVEAAETDIERSTVRAPLEATVLQLNVRPGQFAGADQSAGALLIIGRVRPLHLRVDVDEQDAWRVDPKAPAVACVRGRADIEVPLKFVRFAPMIVPKRSLTGSGTERVDTRVLQAIYQITAEPLPLFVGQQMDVFIKDLGAESAQGGTSSPVMFRSSLRKEASPPEN